MIKINYKQFIRDRKWYKFKYITYENKLKRPDRGNIKDEWGYFEWDCIQIAPARGFSTNHWIHRTLKILNKCA